MAENPVAKFRRIFEARLKSGKYDPIDVVQAVKGLSTRAHLVDALEVYRALFDPQKPPQSRNSFELCRSTAFNLFVRAIELSEPGNDLLEMVQSFASASSAQVTDAHLAKHLPDYRKRYEVLDQKDKADLQRRAKKLADDRAAEASRRRYLLDELEKEFRNRKRHAPNPQELLSFVPEPSEARKEFERLAIACDAAWLPRATNIRGTWVMGQFIPQPGIKQGPQVSSVAAMQNVQSAFDAFGRFVEKQLKQPLDLFRLLAWAREPSATTQASLWSAVWPELYQDIVVRGLYVAINNWNIARMIQAGNYVGKDLDFILAPLKPAWKTLLKRRLPEAFKSPRAFKDAHAERRRAKVWGDVKGLELVDEVTSESLITDLVAQYERDPKEVLSRKISLTAKPAYQRTLHINQSVEDVFTVVWIPRQKGTQIAYVEVHAIPGMLFLAQGNRVGLEELIEEKAFAMLAENAAALTQFLLFYLEVLGLALDIVTAGASGGVRVVLMRFLEMRLKDKIVSEGLNLAGVDNPWVQTLAGIAVGMTPSAIRAPKPGALKGLEEGLEHDSQALTQGVRRESQLGAQDRGLKNRLGSGEGDARAVADPKNRGPAGRFDKPPANEDALIRLPAERPIDPTASSGVQEVSIIAANQNVSSEEQQILGDIAALENEEALQMEVQMAARGSASGRGAGTRLPVTTRSVGAANRSVPARSSAPRGGKSLAGEKIALDPNLSNQVGIPQNQRRFVERIAGIFKEEWEARRNIRDPRTRSTQAHVATQRRIKGEYARAVTEEPTGITGPAIPRSDKHLRTSDVAWSSRQGVVVELKATVFLTKTKKGTVLTVTGYDAGRVVETEQIQCYEILYNELGRPVVVVGGNGKIFAPSGAKGWIQIGGPGF
jgi:hypothetical protein